MNNHEVKVVGIQTKNWQPIMNKISVHSRKKRKRLMQKRIRKTVNKEFEIS